VGTGFSFEVVDATAYDDLRPGYARKAVAWVAERGGLNNSSLVLDVAAGTGQLARIIVPLGFRCVAVEPAQNMRSVLKQRIAGLPVVAATAEALPFPDAAADALVVGNAFHHFDAEQAFEEARRVLRHGGVLALFWARAAPDAFDDPIIRRINELRNKRTNSSAIAEAYRSWFGLPPPTPGFTPFERRRFSLSHVIPSRRYVDLYATSSDIAALPERERVSLLAEMKSLADELPETIDLLAQSEVDVCLRI
jgi:SAM-dependent methyltransferase